MDAKRPAERGAVVSGPLIDTRVDPICGMKVGEGHTVIYVVAAAAMSLSSVSVISNALRLRSSVVSSE